MSSLLVKTVALPPSSLYSYKFVLSHLKNLAIDSPTSPLLSSSAIQPKVAEKGVGGLTTNDDIYLLLVQDPFFYCDLAFSYCCNRNDLDLKNIVNSPKALLQRTLSINEAHAYVSVVLDSFRRKIRVSDGNRLLNELCQQMPRIFLSRSSLGRQKHKHGFF
jgi:hypothetical protein